MIYYFANMLFFITGSLFLYLSKVFSLNYFNMFIFFNELKNINFLFLGLSVIFYAAFFSLSIILYLKSEEREFFITLIYYLALFIFLFFLKFSLFNFVIFLISSLLLYYYFNKFYDKQYNYKIIPYGELSSQLLSIVFTIISLYLAILLTYASIHHPVSSYIDDFIKSTTGLDLSKGKDEAYNNLREEINKNYAMMLSNINNYLQYFILSSNISQKQICAALVNKALNNMTSSLSYNGEIAKIDELYEYRDILITFYPIISFFIYYSLISFYLFIVRLFSRVFLILWNKII